MAENSQGINLERAIPKVLLLLLLIIHSLLYSLSLFSMIFSHKITYSNSLTLDFPFSLFYLFTLLLSLSLLSLTHPSLSTFHNVFSRDYLFSQTQNLVIHYHPPKHQILNFKNTKNSHRRKFA